MIWVLAALGTCWWSAHRIERRWVRAPVTSTAVVARAVIFLTAVTTVGQVAGALGVLDRIGVGVGLALFAAVGLLAGPSTAAATSGGEMLPPLRAVEPMLCLAALAGVAAQWTAHVGDAMHRGMVQPDNLWYHGPFVARMAQTGDLGSLAPFGYDQAQYFPLNTHVISVMLTLPTNTDVFVPFVNHGFAALALVSAWAIGRPHRAAIPAVLAVVVVLGLPLVAATQPGQMYNDVATVAAVLAAAALLAGAGRRPGDAEVVLSLLALGWALSTKLTVGPSIGILVAAAAIGLLRARRTRVLLVGTVVFAGAGGVWFARNLVVSGSPLPYADLTIGSFGFRQRVGAESGESLFARRADDFTRYYLDSLDTSLGPLWPLVVGFGVLGAAAAAIWLSGPIRAIAVAAVAGFLAYPFIPLTGGLSFVNNLRYALVALTLGLVCAVLVVARSPRARTALAGLLAAVVAANLVSPHRGRVPAWPDEPRWVIAGLIAAIGAGTSPWWLAALQRLDRRSTRRVSLAVASGAAVLLVVVMPGVEQRYLDRRYTSPDLTDASLYAVVASVDPDRVDAFGAIETYPYFGSHLDRQVMLWNDELEALATAGPQACRAVRSWLSSDDHGDDDDAVIVSANGWFERSASREERATWFADDPATSTVLDQENVGVYQRTGPLDPGACPRDP